MRKERAKLAIAAVGILRAFIVARERDKNLLASLGLKPWGSFDGWSNLVRAAVVWVGMPDPGETRQALAATSDRSVMEIKMLLAGWEEADPSGDGITVSHALELLAKPDQQHDVDAYPTLRNAIAEITPSGQRPSARSIGMKLHHLKGRVCGGNRAAAISPFGDLKSYVQGIAEEDPEALGFSLVLVPEVLHDTRPPTWRPLRISGCDVVHVGAATSSLLSIGS